MYHYISNSAEDTISVGKKIGQHLKPNDIVALYGRLGAGKTTLVQGIAERLGVKDCIISPTFILINEYSGRIPLYHIDLYRLEETAQITDLGIEEYFSKDGACIIEWAEKIEAFLPENYKRVKIEILSENKRKIEASWQF